MKTSVMCYGGTLVIGIALATLAGCGGGQKDDGKAGAQGATTAPAIEKQKVPLVPKVEVADWCIEHGVPESKCTRCNSKLIADFKGKGDWCETHNLPKSQCIACDPELKAKLEALQPKTK
jgi:hypothetical protein